jgi:hypothetical protein
MKLDKIEEVKTLLDDISKAAGVELKKFNAPSYEMPTFIFCNLLERAAINIITIRILIERLEKMPSIEGPIGILLRSNLLDYMIGLYLRSVIKKDLELKDGKDYLNEAIKPIATDHIKYSLMYLKRLKDTVNCTDEMYRNGIKSLHGSYRVFFKEGEINYSKPEEMLIQSSSISPSKLFSKINTPGQKNYTHRLYDFYQLYSKYDHFGILTNHLQARGRIASYKNLVEALKFVVQGMSIYAQLLHSESDVKIDSSKLKELEEKFTGIQLN